MTKTTRRTALAMLGTAGKSASTTATDSMAQDALASRLTTLNYTALGNNLSGATPLGGHAADTSADSPVPH
jgi:hypothetical protein